MTTLQNQTVAILGGSSGIGLAVARSALAQGARVWIAGRDQQRLAQATQTLPAAQARVLDVTDESSLSPFFAEIGALDHLVITAGAVLGATPLRTLDLAQAQDAIASKLIGSLLAAKHAAPHLRAGGSIGFTSGVLGRKIGVNTVLKTVINAGLEAAVRQLARELAPLRVYGVSPGPVDTPNWAAMDDTARRAMFDKLPGTLPVGFVASAQDTAAAYLFAMQARALTGTVIDLDSGALVAA